MALAKPQTEQHLPPLLDGRLSKESLLFYARFFQLVDIVVNINEAFLKFRGSILFAIELQFFIQNRTQQFMLDRYINGIMCKIPARGPIVLLNGEL